MGKFKFDGDFDDFFDLDFKGAQRVNAYSGITSDVSINKVKKGYSIVFRNNCWERICPSGAQKIKIAVKNGCVFFKQDEGGWKLTTNKSKSPINDARYVSVGSNAILPALKDCIGDYKLQHMGKIGYFYVDASEKEVGR